jgi:hypothetical protein
MITLVVVLKVLTMVFGGATVAIVALAFLGKLE